MTKNKKKKEYGPWFAILFWTTMIVNPIMCSANTFLGFAGGMDWLTVLTNNILSGGAMLGVILLRKKIKDGWTVLVITGILSVINTIILNPDLWWVIFTTGAGLGLWYLSLIHRGYWSKIQYKYII